MSEPGDVIVGEGDAPAFLDVNGIAGCAETTAAHDDFSRSRRGRDADKKTDFFTTGSGLGGMQ